MSADGLPLLRAERRCTDLEQLDEGDVFAEEMHMLALWYELKRVRAQLASEQSTRNHLIAKGLGLEAQIREYKRVTGEMADKLRERGTAAPLGTGASQ